MEDGNVTPLRVCCSAFDGRILHAGERGLSIIPIVQDQLRFFQLQSRANVNLASQGNPQQGFVAVTGIKFCPWCGTDVSRWILENSEEFQNAARQLRRFAII